MLRSKRPSPTTVRPITAPLENATLKPAFKLFIAAAAVLFEDCVAIVMPIKPERPEKNPPVRKAKGTNMGRYLNRDSAKRIKNTAIKNKETPKYCLFRYAFAP